MGNQLTHNEKTYRLNFGGMSLFMMLFHLLCIDLMIRWRAKIVER